MEINMIAVVQQLPWQHVSVRMPRNDANIPGLTLIFSTSSWSNKIVGRSFFAWEKLLIHFKSYASHAETTEYATNPCNVRKSWWYGKKQDKSKQKSDFSKVFPHYGGVLAPQCFDNRHIQQPDLDYTIILQKRLGCGQDNKDFGVHGRSHALL